MTVDGLDCRAANCSVPAIISGIPDHMIRDVVLKNVNFVQQGGDSIRKIGVMPPELARAYPEATMFGHKLPTRVLFARHVNGLKIEGMTFATIRPDERPDFWFENVVNWNISGFGSPSGTATPTIYTAEAPRYPAYPRDAAVHRKRG